MHELSITEEMLKLVQEQSAKAGISKVEKINMVVGELTGFVNDSIQFYFDIMSKDTVAENAQLVFKKIPGRLQCRNCKSTFELKFFDYICPNCEGTSMKLIAGNELLVESIEGD